MVEIMLFSSYPVRAEVVRGEGTEPWRSSVSTESESTDAESVPTQARRYHAAVPLTLIAGPPGSGKTTRQVEEARAAAARGERVWWVGLPSQRDAVLRALVRDGPLLGVEVLTLQQLAYRLLSDARRLRPLLTGTGRLATVGEALLEDRDEPPSPGEARLFARAIAEAKRHLTGPGALPGSDPETRRLRRVWRAYERRKADAWDYDDFRREAAVWLEEAVPSGGGAAGGTWPLLPDRVLVDGLREIGPPDLRLLDGLARHVPVTLAVAIPPPERTPDVTLPPRDDVEVRRYRFANPVAEARWVLRDVKAELATGAEPLDLALIVPPGRARAIATLADEAGVPLMDETPRGLADRPEGRRLLDLLELGEQPSASRLLAVPELHGLGAAALEDGVAGHDAIRRLAEARGEGELWRSWRERLEPAGDALAWGAELVEAALEAAADQDEDDADADVGETDGGSRGTDGTSDPWGDAPARRAERFRDHALQRLAEARRVAGGPRLRRWWAALLQEEVRFARPNAGVALLHAVQASGRRVRRAWIVGAAEGAHLTGEREDYFVPEEGRVGWPVAFERPALPRRYLGRQAAEAAELRARGDVTVVTVPEADQGGPIAPDATLLGGEAEPPPERPAASVLELGGTEPYRPPEGPVPLGTPTVGRLARFARCGLRAWAERRVPDAEETPAWLRLRRRLRERPGWPVDQIQTLADEAPEHADWLAEHAEALAGFSFGVELRDGEDGPLAVLDGARRDDRVATLLRFAAPGAVRDAGDAEALLDASAREYWAAGHLLDRHARQVRAVRFEVWPVGGSPVAFPERGPVAKRWGRFDRARREVDGALPAWRAGEVRPSPGFVCRDCPVFDFCREGRR